MRSAQLLFAWRMLRKNPATSFLAVIALAVGIGASPAIRRSSAGRSASTASRRRSSA